MAELVLCVLGCFTPLVLIMIGLVFGRQAEAKHFQSLSERESAVGHVVVTDMKTYVGGMDGETRPFLITAEAVMTSDAMKNFLASFRQFFGGEIVSYQTLLERARREAVVRLMEVAHRHGCDAITCLRIGTADMGNKEGDKKTIAVAVIASATAYRMAPRLENGTSPSE